MKSRFNPTRWCLIVVVITLTAGAAYAKDFSAWKHRMPIKLADTDPQTAGLLPVDVTFSLKAEKVTDPVKEIRLIYEAGGKILEVPFQLSRLSRWTKDTDNTDRSVPSQNGTITFFDVSGGKPNGIYYILYGNPNAEAPRYSTDLKVAGRGPAWTVENSKIKVELRGADSKHSSLGGSGQLAQVTIKSRPGVAITNSRHSLHWNPGIYIPKRGWIHAYAWNPPEIYEIEQGPIYVEVKRSGPFPKIPEAHLSITYRFFKERNYIWSGTRVDIKEDIGVAALRNDELVFDRPIFTHFCWQEKGQLYEKRFEDYTPVNPHGDILRLGPEIPFLAVYNPCTKVGAATVRMEMANIGPMASPQTEFDIATYIAAGNTKDSFMYWFRSQSYFFIDWDRKQLITIPKGSIYAERNLYCFYDTEEQGNIDGVLQLSRAVHHQPDIQIGPYQFPPNR